MTALEYSSGTLSPDGQESGYDSPGKNKVEVHQVYFTKLHLKFLNKKLQKLEPEDIIRWCMISLPNLYQTTAFGLTGLVTIDMISKIDPSHGIDLIFLDTLHHFSETIDLLNRLSRRYPKINVHVYKPNGVSTVEEFSHKYGEKIWELDDTLYDYVAKVEPAERAYRELRAMAVLTGRRKSQGGKRGELDIIEVDDAGLVKVNPLANWSFQQVKEYIDKYKVPYNVLLDRGYKSVGDWHSTQPVTEGEDERAGRWKGLNKSECGIHNKRSKYAQYLRQLELNCHDTLAGALRDVDLEQGP